MPASKLIEYQWPQEKGSEWYMLQEQVTEYLDIVSFKRKYPGERFFSSSSSFVSSGE